MILDFRLGTSHLVNLLKAMYTNTSAQIKGLKNVFAVETGCRQGGIESPVIFNIYFDTVCRVLDHELETALGDSYGYKFRYEIPNECTNREMRRECPARGWTLLRKVLYADDMVLVFTTKEALQQGLLIVERVFSRYDLTLARKKTEKNAK